jgi:spore coat protein YutH
MNNYINYYYNLYPTNIYNKPPYFYFDFNNEKYYFVVYERPLPEIKPLFELNIAMLNRNLPIHEIILNKDKNPLTFINNVPYILLRINCNEMKKVNISDINFLHLYSEGLTVDPLLDRTDWGTLWSQKIDYIEYQFGHIGKKYPLLCECLGYFIGLGENAISYINNTKREIPNPIYERITISHKRIKPDSTLFELYNPLNFIMDYQIRDCAEYIKEKLFANNDIWPEIQEYFQHNSFSPYSLRLLYSRLLFPTYFFDQYELIITNQDDPESLNRIINKVTEYEQFLKDFYRFINVNGNIPPIEWLNKTNIN